MNRILDQRFNEVIWTAFDALERVERIVDRIRGVNFLCGVSPAFVGLHPWRVTADGRSFDDTGHFVAANLQGALPADRRAPTIVLPVYDEWLVSTVIHELGHALDHAIGCKHTAKPITEYAETNRGEAFAEAFCAWRCPQYAGRDLMKVDLATHELFEYLAA